MQGHLEHNRQEPETSISSPAHMLSLDTVNDCPVCTPLDSPEFQFSQPLYSPAFGPSLVTAWSPSPMEAAELQLLADNIIPSISQPADIMWQTNSLENTTLNPTVQISTDFEDGISYCNNDNKDNAPCNESSQQNSYRLSWSSSSEQSNSCPTIFKAHTAHTRMTTAANGNGNGSREYLDMDSASHRSCTRRRNSTSKARSSSGSEARKSFSLDGTAKHNMTEKRYRSRLNDKFGTLLSTLPQSLVADITTTNANPEHGEKRVSKAEVLILAKEHIRALEQAAKTLEEENQALVEDAEKLGSALLRSNGRE
ncbi:uncharacterized protein LY89DRAFT_167008 [Mollisia scopiformis]|uniref:BHLH domain-containing protein n=1 Tax=Mollisia scopiformis TaxID=149040 RepID=A0A194XSB9_MOLSC|nr:uncharacterized protein LY89DRAFT_167008 [Mollisia scopiformis]KUJ23093.1 hypothetical protein LY89DRAFT_167008 [Mollisia scopiformis]